MGNTSFSMCGGRAKNVAKNFSGEYGDVNHNHCPRIIEVLEDGKTCKVTGHDEDGKWWEGSAVIDIATETIDVDLSKKGGPQSVVGKWTGTGINWTNLRGEPCDSRGANINKPNDGCNGWPKKDKLAQAAPEYLLGEYEADAKFPKLKPGQLSRKIEAIGGGRVKISGHDGSKKPWSGEGVGTIDAKDGTIDVDLSSIGGPKSLKGAWNGHGICWTHLNGKPCNSAGTAELAEGATNDGKNGWKKFVQRY